MKYDSENNYYYEDTLDGRCVGKNKQILQVALLVLKYIKTETDIQLTYQSFIGNSIDSHEDYDFKVYTSDFKLYIIRANLNFEAKTVTISSNGYKTIIYKLGNIDSMYNPPKLYKEQTLLIEKYINKYIEEYFSKPILWKKFIEFKQQKNKLTYIFNVGMQSGNCTIRAEIWVSYVIFIKDDRNVDNLPRSYILSDGRKNIEYEMLNLTEFKLFQNYLNKYFNYPENQDYSNIYEYEPKNNKSKKEGSGMNYEKFLTNCKTIIKKYYEEHFNKVISTNEIYVVWLTKVLQNNKALLCTTVKDNMYYEITYNGDKNEIYFDAYNKDYNNSFNVDEDKNVDFENNIFERSSCLYFNDKGIK